MKNTIIIMGSSYRCGSTLVQRILNSIPNVLILGEENIVLPSVGRSIKYACHRDVESKKQRDLFIENPNCWQANLGMERETTVRASGAYYYQWFKDMSEKVGYDEAPKTVGFKSLFATTDTLMGAVNIFENPYILFLHRNFQDSFTSYSKCKWRSYSLSDFANRWESSMHLLDNSFDSAINDRVAYEDIKTLDWLRKIQEKLDLQIDWPKATSILKDKIRHPPNEQDKEIQECNKRILENLCP